MKTKVKGFNAIIFFIFFIFPLTPFAQQKVEKTLDWKWEIKDNTAISFINKIGDLEITTWNKNEVYLEADVKLKGKEEDVNLAIKKIQEMPVKHSDLSLEINSKFYDSWVQRSVIGIGNIKLRLLDGDKITLDEFSVKFRLVIPETAIFLLQQKYEDLTMADLAGKISLELYDCDFEAGNISNDSKISMKYSKGTFKNLDNALLTIYDSKLIIEKTEDITFNSKYSEVTIKESGNITLDSYDDEIYFYSHADINGKAKYTEMECANMDKSNLILFDCKFKGGKVNEFFLESKYTEFYLVSAKNMTFTQSYDDVVTIDYVGDLRSKSKYTDYTFENLANSISMDSYDDNITIINLDNDFSGIDMTWKYTDLIIGMSSEAKYKLNFDTKYTTLEYPKSKIKETYYHKENSEFKFQGIVNGADENSCATIKINGYDGKLLIR